MDDQDVDVEVIHYAASVRHTGIISVCP
jgi:hypothetical protein